VGVFSSVPVLSPLLAVNITVGTHVTTKFLGLTWDLDTLWSTGAAVVVIVVLVALLRRKSNSLVPSKYQLVWEMGVDAVNRQVGGSIGPRGRRVIPLAIALFVFILVANFFEIFGVGSRVEALGPPTADVSLPLAMAVFVIVGVHIASIRTRGIVGYVRHYFAQPFPKFLFPANGFINVVEEIARPVTLALRLFGNLFSGGLMLTLIAALGAWKIGPLPFGDLWVVVLGAVWKAFDVLLIGPIQAFIFALLTILYYDTAMATEH
jgi:F-type H+-transporting ATPase subunit a